MARPEDGSIPQTPAPVFAFRALKSAILGSPETPRSSKVIPQKSRDTREGGIYHSIAPCSPSKKAGILLTPRSLAVKRKSVSFGSSEKTGSETTLPDRRSLTGLPDQYPGKFPSPWTPRDPDIRPGRRPSQLTSKFRASVSRSEDENTSHRLVGNDLFSTSKPPSHDTSEATLDLLDPNEDAQTLMAREQRRTLRQMRRLLQYKNTAKSFAKLKDAESARLSAELARKNARIAELERGGGRSTLSSKPSNEGLDRMGTDDEIKELCTQASFMQSSPGKGKLKSEGLGSGPIKQSSSHTGRTDEPELSKKAIIMKASDELRRARQQLQEMESVKQQLGEVREQVAALQTQNNTLQAENSKLRRESIRGSLRLGLSEGSEKTAKFETRQTPTEPTKRAPPVMTATGQSPRKAAGVRHAVDDSDVFGPSSRPDQVLPSISPNKRLGGRSLDITADSEECEVGTDDENLSRTSSVQQLEVAPSALQRMTDRGKARCLPSGSGRGKGTVGQATRPGERDRTARFSTGVSQDKRSQPMSSEREAAARLRVANKLAEKRAQRETAGTRIGVYA